MAARPASTDKCRCFDPNVLGLCDVVSRLSMVADELPGANDDGRYSGIAKLAEDVVLAICDDWTISIGTMATARTFTCVCHALSDGHPLSESDERAIATMEALLPRLERRDPELAKETVRLGDLWAEFRHTSRLPPTAHHPLPSGGAPPPGGAEHLEAFLAKLRSADPLDPAEVATFRAFLDYHDVGGRTPFAEPMAGMRQVVEAWHEERQARLAAANRQPSPPPPPPSPKRVLRPWPPNGGTAVWRPLNAYRLDAEDGGRALGYLEDTGELYELIDVAASGADAARMDNTLAIHWALNGGPGIQKMPYVSTEVDPVSDAAHARLYTFLLEHCAEGTLASVIRDANRLRGARGREKWFLKLFWQLVKSVWHMHEAAIAHRDLRLETVQLTAGWDIRVGAFGRAVRVDATKEGGADPRGDDIRACGEMLFACLLGEHPPHNRGDVELALQKGVARDTITQEATDLLRATLGPAATRPTAQEMLRHRFFL